MGFLFKMDFSTVNVIEFSDELLNLMKQETTFERVKEILDNSVHHQVDSSGATLLHYAAQYNNVLVIQYLLDREIDVNVQDSSGNTPLMIGVSQNHKSVIKILMSAGADIFKLNKKQENVLHMMSVQRAMVSSTARLVLEELKKKCSTHEEVAEKLLDANFPLFHVLVLKDSKIIDCMLRSKQGCLVNYVNPSNKITAIHKACIYDDILSLRVLVEFGADVNALDNTNESPLCKLYKSNTEHNSEKIEILKILLSQGASTMSCTFDGRFQMHNILTKGSCEAIRLVLKSVLDFNIKDNHTQKSIIHYLASNTNPGVVAELSLFADKINIDSCDEYGQTALIFAAFEGNIDMVKFLLKQNASTDAKNHPLNTTPIYYAYANIKPGRDLQYQQCGETLLQHNADPQCVAVKNTGEKITVFDCAIQKRDYKRLMPVIAHLAILKKRGTKITEPTLAKINSYALWKEYFKECQDILGLKISGRVKLFDFLISNMDKMAIYLNNENIVRKLKDKSCYKHPLRSYRYYYNCLNRLFCKGKYYKKLKDRASKMICRIFQNRIHERHFITNKVIGYLDRQSLKQLSFLNIQLSQKSEK